MSEEKLKVITINKPSKEQASKKIKELCKHLEKTWFLPLKTK